jgi:hypothetical protein
MEEKIDLNISSDTILRIAILIIGGLVIVESLPTFCRQLFTYYQEKNIFKESPSAGWLIYHFIKSIFGYLLLTKSKFTIDFINKMSKEKLID